MSVNRGGKSKASDEASRLLMMNNEAFEDEPAFEEDASVSSSDDSYNTDSVSDAETTSFASGNAGMSDSDNQHEQEKKALEELTKRETAAVITNKETATGLLMIIAFIACVGAFVFMGKEEHNQFQNSVSQIK